MGAHSNSEMCRFCCKTILSARAGNIDSRTAINAQHRFKIVSPDSIIARQSPATEFCNKICLEETFRGAATCPAPRPLVQKPLRRDHCAQAGEYFDESEQSTLAKRRLYSHCGEYARERRSARPETRNHKRAQGIGSRMR